MNADCDLREKYEIIYNHIIITMSSSVLPHYFMYCWVEVKKVTYSVSHYLQGRIFGDKGYNLCMM